MLSALSNGKMDQPTSLAIRQTELIKVVRYCFVSTKPL